MNPYPRQLNPWDPREYRDNYDESDMRLRLFMHKYQIKPSNAVACMYKLARLTRSCSHGYHKTYCERGVGIQGFDHTHVWNSLDRIHLRPWVITTQPYHLYDEDLKFWEKMCRDLGLKYEVFPELSWHCPASPFYAEVGTKLVVFSPVGHSHQ